MLIEALCAILIFSFGVLGLVGLQTSATGQSGDAKLRSAAAELADDYINQMWVANRASGALKPVFQSGGTRYKTWLGNSSTAGTVIATLPGVTATALTPTVTFTTLPSGCTTTCTTEVDVVMFWQTPHDLAQSTTHQYEVIAQISAY